MKDTSKKFQLDKNDLLTIAKNAALVAAAATVTYLGETIANVDLGPSTAFIVPVATLALHALGRWLRDYKTDKKEENKGE